MAIITKSTFSSAHWYTADGLPAHRQPKKSGEGDRATDIRDARRLGLFPSVTSILGTLAKPQLDSWKLDQVAYAAAASPKQAEESEEYYAKRIRDAAFAQVDDAADLGSRIHDSIERALRYESIAGDMKVYVDPVLEWMEQWKLDIVDTERTMTNNEFGFAGTVDAVGRMNGQPWVLDYKTRKTKEGQKVTPYDGQAMQVAAYGKTYWGPDAPIQGANIFISTTEPGRVEVCTYEPEQMEREWVAFRALTHLWRHMKKYDPRQGREPKT